ncbi:hypothetical protein PPROV_000362900 [Pycnococcus provasolii]|uniref:Uncharacterized protein n=2 Tax=Pycnococcus provasolii TaxID=41880 RepID=A0A830HIK1_9CHLO|nr:hypothetical protein PPROV_000362900 [Pycnococcus provasolii]
MNVQTRTAATALAREVEAVQACVVDATHMIMSLRIAVDAACSVPPASRDDAWAKEVSRHLQRTMQHAHPCLQQGVAAAACVGCVLEAWTAAMRDSDDDDDDDDDDVLAHRAMPLDDDDIPRMLAQLDDIASLPMWLVCVDSTHAESFARRIALSTTSQHLSPVDAEHAAQDAGVPPGTWHALRTAAGKRRIPVSTILAVLVRRCLGGEAHLLRLLHLPAWLGAPLPCGQVAPWCVAAPLPPPPPARDSASQTKRAAATDAAARATVENIKRKRAEAVISALAAEMVSLTSANGDDDIIERTISTLAAVFGEQGTASAAALLTADKRSHLISSLQINVGDAVRTAMVAYLNGVGKRGAVEVVAGSLLCPSTVAETLVETSCVCFDDSGGSNPPSLVLGAFQTCPVLVSRIYAAWIARCGGGQEENDEIEEEEEEMEEEEMEEEEGVAELVRKKDIAALGQLVRALVLSDLLTPMVAYEQIALPLLLHGPEVVHHRHAGLEVLKVSLDAGLGWWQKSDSTGEVVAPGVACLRAMAVGSADVHDGGVKLLTRVRTRSRAAEGDDEDAHSQVSELPWAVQLAVPPSLYPPGAFILPQPLLPFHEGKLMPPVPPPPSVQKTKGDHPAARAARKRYASCLDDVLLWVLSYAASGDRAAERLRGRDDVEEWPGDACLEVLLEALRDVPNTLLWASAVRVLAAWLPRQSIDRSRRVLSVALPKVLSCSEACVADLSLRVAACLGDGGKVAMRYARRAAAAVEAGAEFCVV